MTEQGKNVPPGPETDTADERPRFDETALQLLAQDGVADARLVASLVAIYLTSTPNTLAQLRTAAEERDLDALVRLAHALKSSSAQVGAARLSAYAAKLEALARRLQVEEPLTLAARLKDEFDAVRPTLAAIAGVPVPPEAEAGASAPSASEPAPEQAPQGSAVSQALQLSQSMQVSQ